MNETNANITKNIKANQHESYGTFTLITTIIPFVGFILGIVYLTKYEKVDKKLGEHLIAWSILFSIIWWVVLSMFVFRTSNNIVTSPIVTTPISSGNSQQAATEPTAAHIGSTVKIGSDNGLAVTVQQIIDPATAEYPYPSATAGDRFVAVKLQIANNGSSSIEGNANLNVKFIGTDNQNANISFSPISGCTGFSYGSYKLSSNSSVTGCVVFQLADNISASKIQFQENSGFSGGTGEWLVP